MILLLSLALMAAPGDDPAAELCLDSVHTQLEMNECADAEWRRADAALNAEYRAALARIGADDNQMSTDDGRPAGDVLLRDVQRAWVTQREQMCQLQSYGVRGGSAEGFAFNRCRADVTRERTAWLRQLAPAEDNGQ
jgi:uncharacterized protein YecT (DUF1311 family)